MSGHSKFANIKHKKEKNDAAKGKIFTKLGRELAVAVKEGGGPDPANNSRLRDVIAKAKANNDRQKHQESGRRRFWRQLRTHHIRGIRAKRNSDHCKDTDRQQEPYCIQRKKCIHKRKRKCRNTGMRLFYV